MTHPLVEVHGLKKTYPGPVEALRGIDFSFARGEIFALLGPNGAGKTTTVRILATLSQPSAGRALIDGHHVVNEAPAVRRLIGYVGQASAVDERLTARENLMLQGRLQGLAGGVLKRRVEEMLSLIDLAAQADRPSGGWSGGMRRRLDLAMGLIHGPRLLFLDEPSAGLDPESRAAIWSEIADLAHGSGMGILLTTHYLEEADRLADRVAIIDRGTIVAIGTPEELKSRIAGDVLIVEFADPADLAEGVRRLKTNEAVRDLRSSGRTLHLTVENGAQAIPVVMTALQGVAVVSISIQRPTLDDVYLAATGRTMREAEAGIGAENSDSAIRKGEAA
ncbi:MAG: ATP-binding cassette domain-containing protein [Alphaproteobacteria bacterium]|nr:MAG: ATP-binding cassette domain-containing protein [Alphaproteobacteria bacterium]